MIDLERFMSKEATELLVFSKELDPSDISVLVDWLTLKDDNVRYRALTLLQKRAQYADDVYPFWDTFQNKLNNINSYQRSIGLMMIAANVKWDRGNKFEQMFDEFFDLLHDGKPITIRQFIQSLKDVIPYKQHLNDRIAEKLINVDLLNVRETMRKSILLDILEILIAINKYQKNPKIDSYIFDALIGGILDKKSIKKIESML